MDRSDRSSWEARKAKVMTEAGTMVRRGVYPSVRRLVDAGCGCRDTVRRVVLALKADGVWTFETRAVPGGRSRWQAELIRSLCARGLTSGQVRAKFKALTGQSISKNAVYWRRSHEVVRPSDVQPCCEAELIEAISNAKARP